MQRDETLGSSEAGGSAKDLRIYGWDERWAQDLADRAPGLAPGRVVVQGRLYRLVTAAGEVEATPAGRLRHQAAAGGELPVVGDWVALRAGSGGGSGRIEAVLARRSQLSRKVPGERSVEQVVAANVHTAFVIMGLDGDYNLRRLERFLSMVWSGGCQPVVLLSKADLLSSEERTLCRRQAEEVSPGVEVRVVSSLADDGLEDLEAFLPAGRTVVLLGSSGVGKSTLLNRLLSRSLLRTAAVRAGDDRGRHTTTHRELLVLPGGALVIDSPGVREIQLWNADEGLAEAFGDIETLAADCRFRDCEHRDEPGCAVVQAVVDGRLPAARLESLRALRREQSFLDLRQEQGAQRAEKLRWKAVMKAYKRRPSR